MTIPQVASVAPPDSNPFWEKGHTPESIPHSNHASASEWGAVFALLGPGLNDSSRQQSFGESEDAFLRNASNSSSKLRLNASHEVSGTPVGETMHRALHGRGMIKAGKYVDYVGMAWWIKRDRYARAHGQQNPLFDVPKYILTETDRHVADGTRTWMFTGGAL